MKVVLTTMTVIVFFTIAMLFSMSNKAMVDLNYLVGSGNFNISYLIGLSFLSGFVICWVLFYSMYLQLKLKMTLLQNKLKKSELDDLSTTLKNKV